MNRVDHDGATSGLPLRTRFQVMVAWIVAAEAGCGSCRTPKGLLAAA